MNVSAVFFKQTERAFLRQLVGDASTHSTRSARSGQALGLAPLLGWRVWHDRATSGRRSCAGCGTEPLRCASCGHVVHVVRNDPGFPDLVLVRGERLVVAELKSERGRVTPAQDGWLRAFARVRTVTTRIWRPSAWREIETCLR